MVDIFLPQLWRHEPRVSELVPCGVQVLRLIRHHRGDIHIEEFHDVRVRAARSDKDDVQIRPT